MRFVVALLLLVVTGRVSAEQYLPDFNQFVLLDSSGVEAPQRVGDVGTPFGVLLAARPGRQGGLCSATHITVNLVITAAHCLKAGFEPRDYFALYYDRRGQKTGRAANAILFKGDSILDVAIFDFGDSLREWDILKGKPKALGARQLSNLEEYVTAWSFTPIQNFPDHESRYAPKSGAVFTPNRCKAARRMPHIEIQRKDASGASNKIGEVTLGSNGRLDEKKHLFMDQCRYRVVQGNSGSLVTASENLAEHYGILHLYVGDKDALWNDLDKLNKKHGPLEFFFRGAGEFRQRITWGFGDFLIGSAALLDASEELKAILTR